MSERHKRPQHTVIVPSAGLAQLTQALLAARCVFTCQPSPEHADVWHFGVMDEGLEVVTHTFGPVSEIGVNGVAPNTSEQAGKSILRQVVLGRGATGIEVRDEETDLLLGHVCQLGDVVRVAEYLLALGERPLDYAVRRVESTDD